jgi:hypothetical protein
MSQGLKHVEFCLLTLDVVKGGMYCFSVAADAPTDAANVATRRTDERTASETDPPLLRSHQH